MNWLVWLRFANDLHENVDLRNEATSRRSSGGSKSKSYNRTGQKGGQSKEIDA
jgi:hypothetical protein